MGVPGVTNALGQSVTLAPGLGWHNLNVGQHLWDEFSTPVWIDNDVNVFLRGEHLKGSMQNVTNGIGITIGTGIGGSLLINGDIYRGSNGAAGEVGYWAWSLPDERYNQQTFGEFESFASGPGIARRAQELLAKEPQAGKTLRELVQNELEAITAKEIFAAAQAGDENCLQLIEETAEVLGLVLANLSTVLRCAAHRNWRRSGSGRRDFTSNLFAPPLRKSRPIPPKWSNLVWDIVLPLLVPPPDFCIAKDKVTMFP
ncbi:MAG: ROK family protein [Limnochordia bacterium]